MTPPTYHDVVPGVKPAEASYPKQASPLLVSAKLYDALHELLCLVLAQDLIDQDVATVARAKAALRFARENGASGGEQ